MTDMDILSRMIIGSAMIPLQVKDGRASVVLTEPQSPGSSVTISGIPFDAVVIKVDAFKSPDTVFAGEKGECKRADFVIIADTKQKKRILFIEMKKTKGSRNEIVAQLTGAMCFLRYCQEIGRCFWNERDFLNNFQYRFISFGHLSMAKRRTRPTRPAGLHDTPEKMMQIDWPAKQQFNHLVGA